MRRSLPSPDLAAVLERALSRYLANRGLELEGDGELAALISEELAGTAPAAVPGPAPVPVQHYYQGGRRLTGQAPATRGVFTEDVELWLEESGSAAADKVQIVFAIPEFDGGPPLNDAWSIVVNAEDSATAGSDAGRMFFSTPSFTDALQLFTDGSAVVPELRLLTLRRLSSPPFSCTSLQEGSFYWDDSVSTLCVCDGSGWEPIDSDSMVTCA